MNGLHLAALLAKNGRGCWPAFQHLAPSVLVPEACIWHGLPELLYLAGTGLAGEAGSSDRGTWVTTTQFSSDAALDHCSGHKDHQSLARCMAGLCITHGPGSHDMLCIQAASDQPAVHGI